MDNINNITINHILSDYNALRELCNESSILERVTWLMHLKEMSFTDFRPYQMDNLILFINDMSKKEKYDYLETLIHRDICLQHHNMARFMKTFKTEFETISNK